MSETAGTNAAFPEPRRLRTPRTAAAAGLVFALLFTASILLIDLPARTNLALQPTLLSSQSLAALYLVPFAGVAFLWFIGVIRERIGVHEDQFFATVFLGTGMLFVCTYFGAAAVVSALAALAESTSPVAEFGRLLARSSLYVYSARSAGAFTLVTSTIVLRTGATTRWAGYLGIAVGLFLMLTISLFDVAILLFPAWVALLSVLILVATRGEPAR